MADISLPWVNLPLATLPITLASMPDQTGRVGDLQDNTGDQWGAAMIYVSIVTTNASDATVAPIYLLRYDAATSPSYATDNAPVSDSVFSDFENASILRPVRVSSQSNGRFQIECTTEFVGGLGPYWNIGIFNLTNANFNASAANQFVKYSYYHPQSN